MIIEESGIQFHFSDNEIKTIKFDDSVFYRKYVNQQPRAKGVDFISIQNEYLSFIEVKNCKGDEANNIWRIVPDNKKRETSRTSSQIVGRDSLDIEIAEKVAMTISALVGALTKQMGCEHAENLSEYAKKLIGSSMVQGRDKILIILFLEGAFGSETRTKKMIMHELGRSIKKKLSWLNCKISVVDSDTYSKKIFEINE